MASEQTNFDIDQGTDFRLDLELLDADGLPIDVTTAVIVGQVRKTASSDTVEAEFVVEATDLANGKFSIKLDAATTSKFKVAPSPTAYRTVTPFAYDLEVHFIDGTVSRILSGVLNVSPEVTRNGYC
jgi:hypothetical protein